MYIYIYISFGRVFSSGFLVPVNGTRRSVLICVFCCVYLTRKILVWNCSFVFYKFLNTRSTMIKVPLFSFIYKINLNPFRSSRRRCSVKKGFLRNSSKFTTKHLCQSLFFDKVAALRPATLLKERFWHRCFVVNFEEFLRKPFLQNTSGRLLLSPVYRILPRFLK